MSGSNSFRGGRGGSAGGNSRAGTGPNDSHFGPVRNDGHFRQQRNAPYSKGPSQHSQSYDGPSQGYKNKFSQGGGQMSHNDYHGGGAGAGGGGGGGAGSHRSSGFRGSSNHIGQDRRGFALPTVDHQQQQQVSFGAKQGRFGNGGPMVPSGSSPNDNGMFPRNRNNAAMHRLDPNPL